MRSVLKIIFINWLFNILKYRDKRHVLIIVVWCKPSLHYQIILRVKLTNRFSEKIVTMDIQISELRGFSKIFYLIGFRYRSFKISKLIKRYKYSLFSKSNVNICNGQSMILIFNFVMDFCINRNSFNSI